MKRATGPVAKRVRVQAGDHDDLKRTLQLVGTVFNVVAPVMDKVTATQAATEYAGRAMEALIAGGEPVEPNEVASLAWKFADHMMSERSKRMSS